jgi:hypothetical protein
MKGFRNGKAQMNKDGLACTTESATPISAELSPVASSGNATDRSEPAPITHSNQGIQTNLGTIVFALFSVLSLLICLVRGVVPIFLAEAALWAGLSLLWFKKNLASPTVNLIVLVVAVFAAAGEGFVVRGQYSTDSYTYLESGKVHYRINTRFGRTDRLWNDGWKPVSFDAPPQELISSFEVLARISLSKGTWQNGLFSTPGKICFDVQNDSSYVLRNIGIQTSLDPKAAGVTPSDTVDAVNLKASGGDLLDRGVDAQYCAEAPRVFPDGGKWSYVITSIRGWKDSE